NIIAKRYTVKAEEINPSKAHPRKGIQYSSPKARISSYQALGEDQLLEVNKIYAKLAILENENILKHVIPHSSNSKLRETIGNAFSSTEVIHYGDIKQENIIEVQKEIVDIFALVQQINGIDVKRIEELKHALIEVVESGKPIPSIEEIISTVKDNITIEEMYELTEGKVEYGKANSIVNKMFYLSKARKNAIALSDVLTEIFGDNSGFEDIIQFIRENGFRVEPEIISRKSGKGVKLSESVNLNIVKEEQALVDEIKELSAEELESVLQNGGLYNAQKIITRTYGNTSKRQENEKIDKSRYYAEAIISKYNFQEIGIEEFKIAERNELIARLQERNCVEIYEKLKQTGIEESQISTVLLNIAMREGLFEQYKNGNLEELLNTRQDVLQNNINIEVVERFLGYYDIENTGIRLKDYQQRAYDKVNKIFEDKKFAQVILPTGAGKSFVALAQMQKYAVEHPNEKMLYLAPQDEILNQIKNYIVKYLHGKQETVGKKEDEIIAEIFPNITFETYSGLLAKKGQEAIKEQYGMIVLDELHRTGDKEWEGKVDSLLANQTDDVKVLGITATPTRDVDGRDMANETAKK
ncbi:MAG: DEAD/DEAH box helicase family protein, partial [Clostridia bacterium]|nr:DEAD/DEAH box helicase family protein [Clostridia bacterium]